MLEMKDGMYLMVIWTLAFIMLINTGYLSPLLGGEKSEFVPVTNFENIREAVDSMEYIQNYVDEIENNLEEKESRIEELETTEWFVKYELVKGELEKERDSHPSVLLFAYFGGFIGFALAFTITLIFYRKQNLNLKERIKTLEAKKSKKEPKTL